MHKVKVFEKKLSCEVYLSTLLTKNLLENQLIPSGIFSLDFRHCRFFRKSRVICENETLNLKNSQTGSSSSTGQEKETMELVFRIQNKSWNTQRNSRRDTGRSSVLETKRSCMELFFRHLKENGTLQPLKRFKDTGHPVFKRISALSRGILKKKHDRDTIHFHADASNTELLFRIIHSVNPLSIYGAVSNFSV